MAAFGPLQCLMIGGMFIYVILFFDFISNVLKLPQRKQKIYIILAFVTMMCCFFVETIFTVSDLILPVCEWAFNVIGSSHYTIKVIVSLSYIYRVDIALVNTKVRYPTLVHWVKRCFVVTVLIFYVFNLWKVFTYYNNYVAPEIIDGEATGNLLCIYETNGWGYVDEALFGTVDFCTLLALVAFYVTQGHLNRDIKISLRRIIYLSFVTFLATIFSILVNVLEKNTVSAISSSMVDIITDIITFMVLYSGWVVSKSPEYKECQELESVIQNRKTQELFVSYCAKFHAEENVLFLVDVQEIKSLTSLQLTPIVLILTSLNNLFVKYVANSRINLSMAVIKKMCDQLQELHSVFDIPFNEADFVIQCSSTENDSIGSISRRLGPISSTESLRPKNRSLLFHCAPLLDSGEAVREILSPLSEEIGGILIGNYLSGFLISQEMQSYCKRETTQQNVSEILATQGFCSSEQKLSKRSNLQLTTGCKDKSTTPGTLSSLSIPSCIVIAENQMLHGNRKIEEENVDSTQ